MLHQKGCFFWARYFLVGAFFLWSVGFQSRCWAQYIIQAGQTRVVLSENQIQSFNLKWFPDGSMFPVTIGNETYYFAANGGPGNSSETGTIGLASHNTSLTSSSENYGKYLGELAPLWVDSDGTPVSSLRPGLQQPSPDGSQFDRDYAGGGTVYWDPGSSKLIQIYHGERHFDGDPKQFYSSLGIAISSDAGKTFQKLGLIIQPELPPSQGVKVPSSSGSLVKMGDYFYLYYSDISPDGTCAGVSAGGLPCVTVARASVSDVISSAVHGKVAPWSKYYNGTFSESGVGGKFSPLFTTPGNVWPRWPMVTPDPYKGIYFMVYAAGATGLVLRESSDGLNWGAPVQIVTAETGETINYPSIVSVEKTPERPGESFTVLYMSFNGPNREYNRALKGITISLASVMPSAGTSSPQ